MHSPSASTPRSDRDPSLNRRTILLLIALLVAGFGVYASLNGIALLGAGGTPLLMPTFLAQGVLALLAAYGIARAESWAAAVTLLLALLVAATALLEAFALGIVPWLYALFIAVAAIAAAPVIGTLVRGAGGG